MKLFLQYLKKNWLIIIVLILAIILRIGFSTSKTHTDLYTQSTWGRQANTVGNLKGFYGWDLWNNSYPNHPPLISAMYYLIYPLHSKIMWFLSSLGNFIALHRLAPTKFLWLFDFSTWFGTALYGTTAFLSGIFFLMKQFMILADLSITGVIFYLCKKNKTDWKKPVLIYLFLPFSWYLSSSWGQSDQLSFIFLIVSFLLIYSKKYSVTSPLIYAIAANLKPNCVLLLPLYLYTWYKQKQPTSKLFIGGTIAIIFTLWTVSWFTNDNVLIYTLTVLPKKIATGDGFINYNAFNFWYIFFPYIPNNNALDNNVFLMLSAKTWGWILTVITTILSLKVIKNKKPETLFAAMFIAGFGSWLFMTGIHERYSFLAVMPLLLMSIYNKKYFKYFLLYGIIYTLNMFHAYWPWESLNWVTQTFEYDNFLIPKILSIVNVVMYFYLTILLIKNSSKKIITKKLTLS